MRQPMQNGLERLGVWLREYGFRVAELNRTLATTNSFIAGSFPLQVVLNERFEKSDLDIFCNKAAVCELLKCVPSGYRMLQQKHETYDGLESIDAVFGFENDYGQRIQVIVVTPDDVDEYIRTKFDFSFCQTRFNGHDLVIPFGEATRKKIGYIECAKDSNAQRMKKYTKRGFIIHEVRALL